jgi:hypothetical protein
LRDEQTLEKVHDSLQRDHSRGRASRGLARIAQSYLLALKGEVEAAERAFADGEELWARSQGSFALALARSTFALAMGPEAELATVTAEQARRFFTENGYQLFLDGIMSELPDTEHWFEADPLDRSAASSG